MPVQVTIGQGSWKRSEEEVRASKGFENHSIVEASAGQLPPDIVPHSFLLFPIQETKMGEYGGENRD